MTKSEDVIENLADRLWSADLDERKTLQSEPQLAFAYYTSAETAFKIISSGNIFMRDTRLMNDSSEISYGQWLLNRALTDNSALKHLLNDQIIVAHPDLAPSLASDYDELRNLNSRTFVTSLSRHDLKADLLGRLSMWRGYGSVNGVSLIISSAPFRDGVDWGGVFSSPVRYLWPDDAESTLNRDFEEIAKLDIDWSEIDSQSIRKLLSGYFSNFCINTKHPGFAEEKEWRLHCRPDSFKSPWVEEKLETISGVPQSVLKLNIAGPYRELSQVVLGAIVGPSPQQTVIREALISCFLKAGYSEPEKAVQISPTPWVSA